VNVADYIAAYKSQPISHQLLVSLLKEYRRPNDKIHRWLSENRLVALRRGLYLWNSEIIPESFSIANALYGPSYVSCESALAYHGLIPEAVFTVVSMTLNNSKTFTNALGNFEYIKLPFPYYPLGIQYIKLRENQFALLASAEKALFDKVYTTRGIRFRSVESAKVFLLDNMRMNRETLQKLDLAAMESWIAHAQKKDSLRYLIKALEKL